MNPAIISILFILLLFVPCFFTFRSFIITGRLRAQASREYFAMIECIKMTETLAEYQFWLHESNTFINRYTNVVSPALLSMYEVSINVALRKRLAKGFDKTTIPDNN